jgi:hypothetical protein
MLVISLSTFAFEAAETSSSTRIGIVLMIFFIFLLSTAKSMSILYHKNSAFKQATARVDGESNATTLTVTAEVVTPTKPDQVELKSDIPSQFEGVATTDGK